MNRNHIPFYLGVGVAVFVVALSASPPATPSDLIYVIKAQRAFGQVEAMVRFPEMLEFDESMKARLENATETLGDSLDMIRDRGDRREQWQFAAVFILSGFGSVLVGALISQALVIRSLKRTLLTQGGVQP
jgi:hypothetical protein